MEQFLFASSLGVYGGVEQPKGPVTDHTLQRPDLIYGVTKVFGELLGRYYRKAYGIDFRAIRRRAFGAARTIPASIRAALRSTSGATAVSRAIGRPCSVTVISSPALTRSR